MEVIETPQEPQSKKGTAPAEDPGGLIASYKAKASVDSADPGGLIASYKAAAAAPPNAPKSPVSSTTGDVDLSKGAPLTAPFVETGENDTKYRASLAAARLHAPPREGAPDGGVAARAGAIRRQRAIEESEGSSTLGKLQQIASDKSRNLGVRALAGGAGMALGAVEDPVGTVDELTKATLAPALKAGLYIGQNSDYSGGTSKAQDAGLDHPERVNQDAATPTELGAAMGVPRIGDKEGVVAGAQFAAMTFAPLLGALAGRVTARTVSAAVDAAGGSAFLSKAPDAVQRFARALVEMDPRLSSIIGNTVKHGTEGGVVGAALTPDDPKLGAVIGAGLGIANHEVHSAKLRSMRAQPEPSAEQEPGRLLRGGARPADARVEEPPTGVHEPDYTIEPLKPEDIPEKDDMSIDARLTRARLRKNAEGGNTNTPPVVTSPSDSPVAPPAVAASVQPVVTPADMPVAPTPAPASDQVAASSAPAQGGAPEGNSGDSVSAADSVESPESVSSDQKPRTIADVDADIAKVTQERVEHAKAKRNNEWLDAAGRLADLVSEKRALTLDAQPRLTKPAVDSKLDVGQMVTFQHPTPSGSKQRAGTITRLLDDGNVEIRMQMGGYATLPPAEVAAREESTNATQGEKPAARLSKPGTKPVAEQVPPDASVAEHERIPSVKGKTTRVILPNGETLPAEYHAVSLDHTITSHDPHTFLPNPKYPSGVQGRDYQRNLAAQETVKRRSLDISAVRALNPTESANSGPSVALPSGAILAGNERDMHKQRAVIQSPQKYEEYRTQLLARAHEYGLDPDAVSKLKNPALIRILTDEKDVNGGPERWAAINRLSDESGTKAMSATEEGAARATKLAESPALEHFSATVEPEQTIAEYLGTGNGREFVRHLVRDGVITSAELGRMTGADGALTEDGRASVRRTLLSAAVSDPSVLHDAPSSVTRKLEHAIPSIVSTKAGPFDVSRQTTDALRALAEAKGKGITVDDLAGQTSMFGEAPITPETHALAKFLQDATPTKVKGAYRRYAALAKEAQGNAESADMFGGTGFDTPAKAFQEAFGITVPSSVNESPARYNVKQLPASLDTPLMRETTERSDALARIHNTQAINTSARRMLRLRAAARMMRAPDGSRPREGLQAWIVLGLPGAGKSSTAVMPIAHRIGGAVVDADYFKESAPEYENGVGAQALHPESIDVRNIAMKSLVARGANLVFPTVGNPESTPAIVKDLQERGYTVHVSMVDLPNGKAAQRAFDGYMRTVRGEPNGRHFVSPQSILERGDAPRRTFAALSALPGVIADVPLDNDVAEGTPARRVTDWRERWGRDGPDGSGLRLLEEPTARAGRSGRGEGPLEEAQGRRDEVDGWPDSVGETEAHYGPDLFGNEAHAAPAPSQSGMFGGNEGTAESRAPKRLKETEAAARAELADLKQQVSLANGRNSYGLLLNPNDPRDARLLTKQAALKARLAPRIADLERLVNRDRAISVSELGTRRTAAGQGALLEPAADYEKDEPKLAVLHNLSAESLLFADKIGGMSVPSLGVVKAGGAYPGMGEITLIGKSHLGRPSDDNPIHDADVYSPTFPRPQYKSAKWEAIKPVMAEFAPFAKQFDDTSLPDELHYRSVQKADPAEAISRILYSPAGQAAFLASQGITIKPVMRDASVEAPWVDTDAWRAFQKAEGWNDSHSWDDTEYRTKAATAARAAIEEYTAKIAKANPDLAADLRSMTLEHWLADDDGLLKFGRGHAITRSSAAVGRRDVDSIKTRERLERAMKGKKPAFKEWAESKILPLHGDPFLLDGRKKVPYALHHIVDAMKGEVRATQQTLAHGEGKTRAAAATRFGDLTHMRNASYQIGTPATVEAGREKAKLLSERYRNAVLDYSNDDTWSKLDASMVALAKYMRGRSIVDALRSEGFRGVPSEVLTLAKEAANALREAPVPYFEAKPQRAVSLSEFAGAVVPAKTDPRALAVLAKHGIAVQTYGRRLGDAYGETARAKAVAKMQRDLSAQGHDVLFERRQRYDLAQQEMFAKDAIARPDGAAAIRARREEANIGFGSVAKKEVALKRHAEVLQKIASLKLQTTEQRQEDVQRHHSSEWANVVGMKVHPNFMHKVMDLLRDPLVEHFHVFYLGDAERSGVREILHHTSDTSGALTFAHVPQATLDGIVAMAKKLNAVVALGHNHPSGNATASGPDVQLTAHIAKHLEKNGIEFRGHTIIDHNEYALIKMVPDGSALTADNRQAFQGRPAAYQTAVESGAPKFKGPAEVAALLKNVVGPNHATVMVVDSQHHVIGVTPKSLDQLAAIGSWLPKLLDTTGGNAVFIAAPDAESRALADKASQLVTGRHYDETTGEQIAGSANWAHDILDIFASDKLGESKSIYKLGQKLPVRSADFGKTDSSIRRTIGETSGSELPGSVRSEPGVRGGAVAETAFHGTPHTFDKFSLQHIGSGEGNQSFGWGLYFAGKKDLAAYYRKKLTADVPNVSFAALTDAENNALADFTGDSSAFELFEDAMKFARQKKWDDAQEHLEWVLDAAEKDIAEYKASMQRDRDYDEYSRGTADALVVALRGAEVIKKLLASKDFTIAKPKGHLYTVEIPDNDTMLHLDKPISEQPMKVLAAIDVPSSESADIRNGYDYYRSLSKNLGSPKAASLFLASKGVTGIAYLNGQSRAAGKGDYNYVVFDDKHIEIKGVEEKPPAYGADAEGEEPATGVKNAHSQTDRERHDLGARARPDPRTQQEMYDAGKAVAEKDPTAIPRLLDELRADPEKIVGTASEAGLLLKHRVDLDNQLKALSAAKEAAVAEGDAAAEHLARLQLMAHRQAVQEFVSLAERTGTATGRALAARKMMSKLDYSLSAMESSAEAAKGSALTEAELERISDLYEEVQRRSAALEADSEHEKIRAAAAEADLHHANLRLEVAGPLADRVISSLDTAAEAALARIRRRGMRAMAGMDPVELADHAIIGAAAIARGARAFSEWSDAFVRTMGESVRPHLEEIFNASNQTLDKELAKASPARTATAAPRSAGPATPESIVTRMKARVQMDGAELPSLRPYLRQLALGYIRSGITARGEVLDRLHEAVRQALPDATREDVRDTLSGYGDFKPLDKAADKSRLREIQAELQKLAQLDALQKGEAPLATGMERQAPNDETRHLTKQVNDLKRKAGLSGQDREGRLKSALDATKTRTRHAIADLQTEIDTGQRIVRGKHTPLSDPDLEALRSQLADLRKMEAEVFGKPGLTDEQRLRLATAGAKRNVAMWESRLGAAQKGAFPGPRLHRPSTPEIESLRAQAAAAKAEYSELKALDPEQKRLSEDRANTQYRAHLERQKAEILDRMAKEDYAPRMPNPKRLYDRDTMRLKANVEEVKQKFHDEVLKFEKANRTPMQKARDRGLAFVRASALSWPSVIGKLTSVALTRIVTTPLTDAVALGVAKALPRLAAGAPRHGTTSAVVALKAEAAAQAAMWSDGLRDAGRMLQNKQSSLTLLHGKHKLPHAWYEYFGALHGALKEPIKRAEYARSLYRRTVEANMRGENTTDAFVQLRLSTEAYRDAEGAIAMSDNVLVKGWNNGLRTLEQVDKTTGKADPVGVLFATALRIEMPIVKAPTNVVFDASEYIHGLLYGGARAAWSYAKGIEGLKPVERDHIIRLISKGAIGMAIMALYFYKHDDIEFGGFYERGEKRGEDEAPAGGMRIHGHNVKSTWLHNPMLMAGQFAATIARVAPTRLHKKDEDPQGYGSALAAASLGLAEEIPILGSLVRTIHDVFDPMTRSEVIAKELANKAVPGVVQWMAKQSDDPDIKRKPVGLQQHLEHNIPGLRQRVPEQYGRLRRPTGLASQ
jgi:DNA repair protein RadC